MLGLVFRGVFLMAILGWYSANIWRMIDGYFRDQFRVYLEEEYRKNPRIRSDVENHRTVDKNDVSGVDGSLETSAYSHRIEESSKTDGGSIIETVPGKATLTPTQLTKESKRTPADRVHANQAAEESTDKDVSLETQKLGLHEIKKLRSNSHDRHFATVRTIDGFDRSEEKSQSRMSFARHSSQRQENFAKSFSDLDSDFWEFDVGNSDSSEGILVAELPFKPKADIGKLDRVTAEEFCPLSLGEEEDVEQLSCRETINWP